jgi:hypothetical protein
MSIEKQLIGVTFRIPATTNGSMTFLPGGVLDPGYGGAGVPATRIWIGNGVIQSITADPDSGQDYELEIYDLRDVNGKPLASGTAPDLSRHTLAASSATAQRSGYGGGAWAAGTAFQDVTIPSVPAAIVANALRWKSTVKKLATTPPAAAFTDLGIVCRSGLAVVARTAGAITLDCELSISYAPFVTGAVRYQNAKRLTKIFV